LQKSILFSKNDKQILVRKDLAGMLDTEEINDKSETYGFEDKLIMNASLEADKIIKYALSRKDIMLEKVKECRNNESPLLKINLLLNLPYDYSIGPLFNVEYFQQIMGNSYAKD